MNIKKTSTQTTLIGDTGTFARVTQLKGVWGFWSNGQRFSSMDRESAEREAKEWLS